MSKKYRKFRYISLFTLLFLILSACGTNNEEVTTEGETPPSQDSSGEMVIQLATVEPDGHTVTEGAYKFKELLEEKSEGTITVEVFPNQQLGSMREQTEMTQMGSIQMSIAPVSTVGSFVEELQILELPFLFTEEDTMWDVLNNEPGQQLLDTMASADLKGLGLWAGGFKQMTSNIEPIKSPENLKNLNIRVIPSDSLIAQYEAWEANPTPIDFAELYTSLQQGVVDAQENPLITILKQKYYEVQNYLTLTNHAYQFHVMMANDQWFTNLDSDIQELILEAEKEAREFSTQMNQDLNESNLQELIDSGMEVNTLDDEGIQEFQTKSLPLYERAIDTEQKETILTSIQEALAELE
ncbi:TRAP transporter substrate-binding protein [Halalkalibacter oceani]|uniref:TRAP transporter substrate-binding protein n=1 Tax=Halalkalibacter oceani TaxID=1653776 RepID=UPI0033915F62